MFTHCQFIPAPEPRVRPRITSTKSTDTLGFAASGTGAAAAAATCAGAPRVLPAALPCAVAAFAGAAVALALPALAGGRAVPAGAAPGFAAAGGAAEPLKGALPLTRRPSEPLCRRCPDATASREPRTPAAAGALLVTAGAFVDSLRGAAARVCLPASAGGALPAAAPVLTLRGGAAAGTGALDALEVLRGRAPFAAGGLPRASAAALDADGAAALSVPFAADAVVPGVEACNELRLP